MIELSIVRFKANDIADELALVPLVVAHLSSPVEEIDSCHPFVYGKLVLAGEIVDMLDQRAHHLTHPRRGLWTDALDDMPGEIGIEPRCIIGAMGKTLICCC